MSGLDIPVVDLADDVPEEILVEKIASACSEFGFFQVTNHGIPSSLVNEYKHQLKLYFDLPHDVKLTWKRNEANARGYFDDELTKQRRDWKEALDFGVPNSRDWNVADDDPQNFCLDGWNQLPSEEVLPNFRSIVTKYFDECARLSDRLATIMAKGMGRDETEPIIQELREKHSSYLRANFYPLYQRRKEEKKEDGPLGISPHRDAGFLTVLLQDDDCHSLQVWKADEWITVHPVPGAFTINTGDMAQVWSNGRYKAPLHRVLTNDTKERYSAPFFYNPSYGAFIEPLLTAGKERANYHPVLWGYFRAVRFAGDLTDLGVEIQVEDFLLKKEDEEDDHHHVQKQKRFVRDFDFSKPFSVEQFRPLLTNE
jgi:isopenicillin N synthase-like dioxygenase